MNPFWQTRDEATVRLFCGDSLSVLQGMPSESVHCVVTSPPYWSLRDYGVEGQLGSEKTPQEYVDKMVGVFREVRRVLRKDGTVWLNLGDTYLGNTVVKNTKHSGLLKAKERYDGFARSENNERVVNGSVRDVKREKSSIPSGNIGGIPWRVALALQEDGWTLRQDIIWSKKSCMPESVTNRCTKSHEYIFLLTRSNDYYFDNEAIKEKASNSSGWVKQRGKGVNTWKYNDTEKRKRSPGQRIESSTFDNAQTKNLRSVWSISTQPYPGSHFAVFPPEIPLRCIKAGTSEVGCCPECETGWERVVTRQPILRERPNKLTKRTGEEGTGNFCPNDVSGVEYKTLGWKPGCNCYKVGIIKDYPSNGNDEPDDRYNARVQKWLEAWHKLKPTYDALREENLPCIVLDPFIGSGTTCAVAIDLDRDSVGIDISEKYLRNNAIPRISGRLQRYRSKTHLVPRG